MKTRKITITPYGGLANRMRAMNSVIELAKLSSIPVNVVWFSNFELNAPFGELFEKIKESSNYLRSKLNDIKVKSEETAITLEDVVKNLKGAAE